MKYGKNIYEAIFIKRPNRFNAHVLLNGDEIVVHVPNTGRCKELLKEGSKVFLREELNPNRKTKYDLIAVMKNDILISIDSQIPNKVVNEALMNKRIDNLHKYNKINKEKTFRKSRFDFMLSTEDGNDIYYLEVKGVTLEIEGHCMFPDAPTERGARHIMELIEAKKQGFGAGILFLIQLDNVNTFSSNDLTDPEFGKALRLAKKSGVDIMAYNCKIDKEGIELNNFVNVTL